ncbi:response regulator [Mesobacillus maritimus]|uniref:response regulator n=1 Tax=Mesobacillus maritimus TaxID=1643336 RepID=UPI00384F5A11
MIRTLIVEDDPMVAELNRRYLEKVQGFELTGVFSNVESALPVIEREQIDLILLDVYMPGDNGWSLLSKIRWLGKEIDIILITAACDKESIKKGLRFGAVDYLIKPFEFKRFEEALVSYREDQLRMDYQERLDQSVVDQLLLHKEQKPVAVTELPKGVSKDTMKKVWDHLTEIKKGNFSTEELACKVGISRVSMRKYVNFLVDINILETEVAYGTVGRPVLMHRIVHLNQEIIHNYIDV